MRLLSLLLSVIDWQNIYNIPHAIHHDLRLSITFFCWSLCRRNRIRLRVKQTPLPMGRKQDWHVSVCFTEWNKVFLRLKQTVSWYETKCFMLWKYVFFISDWEWDKFLSHKKKRLRIRNKQNVASCCDLHNHPKNSFGCKGTIFNRG